MKIVKNILLKIVIFTAVKNRCILHGRVFVMKCESSFKEFTNFQYVFSPFKLFWHFLIIFQTSLWLK